MDNKPKTFSPLTPKELATLQSMMAACPGDWGAPIPGSQKNKFKQLGMKYLRWLSKGEGKITFNPGGEAVSGESLLRLGAVTVEISATGFGGKSFGVRYQLKKHGWNNWLPLEKMGSREWFDEALVASAKLADLRG